MTPAQQAAAILRAEADRLDPPKPLVMAPERYTLATAMQALRAAVPVGRHFGIQLEVKQYTFADEVNVAWCAWDGDKHHMSSTLTGAVAACLAAHLPGATVETAQAELGIPSDDVVPIGTEHGSTLGEPATAAMG